MNKKGSAIVVGVTLIVVVAILIGLYYWSPQFSPSTQVVLETNLGDITIKLYDDMPVTTDNFVNLVEEGFYDGIQFHRVVPGFVIQAGDPRTNGGQETEAIRDENVGEHSNKKYAVGMANAGPNTGSSQFYVNLKDNIFLDSNYPVFGEVTGGKDVVDKIGTLATNANEVPITTVTIERAYVK